MYLAHIDIGIWPNTYLNVFGPIYKSILRANRKLYDEYCNTLKNEIIEF